LRSGMAGRNMTPGRSGSWKATNSAAVSWRSILGGGFGHFYAYAPFKIEYAIDRFAMEVKRQLDVLDRRLDEHEFIGGAEYSIADIAIWPWYGALVEGKVYDAAEFLDVASYANVIRWAETIGKRPAVRRGRLVNRLVGPEEEQMAERHDAADFEKYASVLQK
jgi:GST-like protein